MQAGKHFLEKAKGPERTRNPFTDRDNPNPMQIVSMRRVNVKLTVLLMFCNHS